MAFLIYDPERLRRLAASLDDLSRQLETLRWLGSDGDVACLVDRAGDHCRRAVEMVETSVGAIDITDTEIESEWRHAEHPVVRDLVIRYRHWVTQSPNWWAQATRGSTRSDELLGTFQSSAHEYSGQLIDSMTDLEALVLGTGDLSTIESLWLRATSPSTTPIGLAGQRIRRLLDVIFEERTWEHGIVTGAIDPVERARRNLRLRAMASRIAAPWQLFFTGRASLWGWSAELGARRLHQLSELDEAADTLRRGLSFAVRSSLTDLPEDSTARRERIDEVARSVGANLEVHRMSEIRRAEDRGDFDTLREVLGALSIDGPWPLSLLVDAGAKWMGDFFDTTDARIRTATLDSLAHREVLASIAVTMVWTAALERSGTTRRRSRRGTAIPFGLAEELRYTYQAFDNASGRGQVLAQLSPRK